MTLPSSLKVTLAALLLGYAVAGGLWLLLRTSVHPSSVRVSSSGLPWWLRACWWPAALLAPALAPLIPQRLHRQATQDLARCDLDGQLTASQWFSLRVCHGLLCAGTAIGIALSLHWPSLRCAAFGCAAGMVLTPRWLGQLRAERERLVCKQLPAYLDVLTLCVEAGATLTASLRMAIDKAPEGPLRQIFERVLREIRSGRTRLEALEHVAGVYNIEGLNALVTGLLQSEGAGVSLGTLLRAQSEQRSAERHIRAEKLALQAPVKMLGPLVLCIFPCTFVVISVPVIARLLDAGQP
jgi:tight adherence protein C